MKTAHQFTLIVFVVSALLLSAFSPFSVSAQTFIGSSYSPHFIGSTGGSFVGSNSVTPSFIGSTNGSFVGSSVTPSFIGSTNGGFTGSSYSPQFIGSTGGTFVGSNSVTPSFIGSTNGTFIGSNSVTPYFIGSTQNGGTFIGSSQTVPTFIGSHLVPPVIQNPTCPSGYTYNASTNTCVGTPPVIQNPTCPSGYTYNASTNTCTGAAPTIQNPTCPSGYTYNASTNTCVGSAPQYTNYNYSNYYPRFLGGSYYYNTSYPYSQTYNAGYYPYSYYQPQQYVGVAGFAYTQPQTTYQEPIIIEQQTQPRVIIRETAAPVVQTTAVSRLKIVAVSVTTDVDGNSIVAFTTNLPAYGEVVFGRSSQNGLDTSYDYEFTTGVISDLVTRHEVNLGRLAFGQVYYIRAVARFESMHDISDELAYIPVPAGEASLQTQPDGLASIFGIGLSGLNVIFFALILIIIILTLYLVFRNRRQTFNT